MSIKMMSRVWDVAPVSGSDLVVLLALADYGDDDGENIFPSIPSIAKKARLSVDQARRVIHKLIEEDKVVELVAPGGWDGKRNRSNEYRIVLSDRPRAGASPRVDASSPRQRKGGTRADASTRPRVDASTVPAPVQADPLLEPLLLTTNDQKEIVPDGTLPANTAKKKRVRNGKSGNPTPPSGDPPPLKEPTEWQKFLEALCWISHGHDKITALTEEQKGLLTAEAKKIKNMEYTIADLRSWYTSVWKKDWKSKNGRPNPATVRSSIASIKSEAPQGFDAEEGEVDYGQATNGAGWHPGEVERIKQLQSEGRNDEATALIRAANARVPKVQ